MSKNAVPPVVPPAVQQYPKHVLVQVAVTVDNAAEEKALLAGRAQLNVIKSAAGDQIVVEGIKE